MNEPEGSPQSSPWQCVENDGAARGEKMIRDWQNRGEHGRMMQYTNSTMIKDIALALEAATIAFKMM